ncbi:hypothetical protein PDIG_68090 [Penicillium digitatum PHI26]|uniref:Uncharacterized protein n=2 Tax=Penicillium digitatum TaxID=36651 RepID=K9FGV6_PEND2|nr:hypothetical protein PDIP_77380 [Penicillium digitatum Pd1]EKV06702.1 hypothetical protein PDIP_77380 [Penicillium digitatum Pd1]EKV08404.1 hypothetical protein PDIG_68090 [Penicillium digitatum PHI26]
MRKAWVRTQPAVSVLDSSFWGNPTCFCPRDPSLHFCSTAPTGKFCGLFSLRDDTGVDAG